MNKAAVIVSALVLTSFAPAQRPAPQHKVQHPVQEALTPDFKDAALEAFDAVENISSLPGVSETEAALTKTEARKALDKAHRKVKSALDRSVYDLLDAYHLFKDMSVMDMGMIFSDETSLATKHKYGEYHTFDLKGEDQCYWEVRVALGYDLEKVTKEGLEQGRSHLCLGYSEELTKRTLAQSEELKQK
jgi:hypothetical protein